MARTENHANRNLRPRVMSDGSRRGIDRYYSFAHGSKPCWWSDECSFADKAFGVYENNVGSSHQAIVFFEDHLKILYGDEIELIRFAEIERLIPPVKTPVPISLKLILRSAATVELPVTAPEGAAFDMYRFLLGVMGDVKRQGSRRE